MTRDDIIRMAKEAGLERIVGVYADGSRMVEIPNIELIERFAALVAAAEQEAVGNIILDYAGRDDLSDSDESLLKHLFELIRARGK